MVGDWHHVRIDCVLFFLFLLLLLTVSNLPFPKSVLGPLYTGTCRCWHKKRRWTAGCINKLSMKNPWTIRFPTVWWFDVTISLSGSLRLSKNFPSLPLFFFQPSSFQGVAVAQLSFQVEVGHRRAPLQISGCHPKMMFGKNILRSFWETRSVLRARSD